MIPDDDYEMRDDDAPAEMSSSTIDRNAMRLIAENEKRNAKAPTKTMAKAALKKVEDKKFEPAKTESTKAERTSMASRRSEIANKAKNFLGMKKGGSVGSASKRADGIASKGKTKGRFI
jgi:hypothetical protein